MIRDIRTAILSILAVFTVFLSAATVAHAAATPAPVSVPVPVPVPCTSEDGSDPGQAFPCRWDATLQGNGRGTSFRLAGPLCTDVQVAASDAAHRAGLPDPIAGACDDADSQLTAD